MANKTTWVRAGLIGAAALIVGCGPDSGDRGATTGRPGDSSLSRDATGQPRGATGQDSTLPPSTTAPNPAAPAAAAPGGVPPAVMPRLLARAEIRPLADNTVRGVIEFQEAAGDGGLMTLHVMLMGLSAGPHGMHVHMGTDCSAPGTHFNPLDAPHGPSNAASGMRHLGDLGNITADASGMVEETLRDSLLGGDATFIGKVIVVHEAQDDLSTQPDGSSGRPIGCGVVEAAGEDVISRGDAPNRGV